MLASMTGFGKSSCTLPEKTITVEMKALNSKNFDLNIRMSSAYRDQEMAMRKRLAEELHRGKVDVFIQTESNLSHTKDVINEQVVRAYMAQMKEIADGDDVNHLQIAMRLPDVLQSRKTELDREELEAVWLTLEAALVDLQNYRNNEGAVLKADFEMRIDTISGQLEQVKEMEPSRMQKINDRLRKSVSDLAANVDENRFEHELIFYLEKLDITEEVVRLKNHLNYFLETINLEESSGKKLGFISQEMGREINTIGSKANDAAMQQLVVQMKDELEKIKEQLLNVL
jgi:uncharacterized protein (TIGR00255 family)